MPYLLRSLLFRQPPAFEYFKLVLIGYAYMFSKVQCNAQNSSAEPLLDCAWSKSQLRCIKQKDFEYKHPVSTLAEITIPRSFVERNGSYRCVPEGHRHHTIKSCRLPQEKGNCNYRSIGRC